MMALGVGIGGGLGALARHGLTAGAGPWATMVVNLLGCLVAGWMAGSTPPERLGTAWHLAATAGFLGGFTTWSSFAVHVAARFRAGDTVGAATLAFVTVGGCLGAALAGLWLGTPRGA